MGTNTPELQLFKPDYTTDNIDVPVDFNNNWDKVDTAVKNLNKENVVIVKLNANFGLAAGTDLFAETNWAVEGSDLSSMAVLSSVGGTKSYILIPRDGRYNIRYTSNYDSASGGVVCYWAIDAPDNAHTYARASGPVNTAGGDGTWLRAEEEAPLLAGQKIYWGNWSSVAGNVRTNTVSSNSRTRITVRRVNDT